MPTPTKRTTSEKIRIFESCFSGLPHIYGTYDPATGRSWQKKKSVSHATFLAHLQGKTPYGVYLLVKDRTSAIAVDIDDSDPLLAVEFRNTAMHYQLPVYIEKSKSKGHHVWMFFTKGGVKALKARLVVNHILEEMDHPDVEVFPKQDALTADNQSGNFINAPLFGLLVPKGKTVFIDHTTLKPYSDQWDFLSTVERVNEKGLDEVIDINELKTRSIASESSYAKIKGNGFKRFALLPCAQKMLNEGVTKYQRVSCFRLAVHLKQHGLPQEIAIAALMAWRIKNSPCEGRGRITQQEIINQTSCVYEKNYTSYGCNSEAIEPFCYEACPLYL